MKQAIFLDTFLGRVGIAQEGGAITNVFLGGSVRPDAFVEENTPLLEEAARQLQEYLEGKRKEFDLPLHPQGTEFQRQVWQALRQIPYGTTITYGQLAQMVGRPSAARAVGQANGRNPISIFIPCHRVVGAAGVLRGYAGGIEQKKKLLHLEGALPQQLGKEKER